MPATNLAFSFPGLAAPTSAFARDEFKAYRKQAVKDSKTPEGEAYTPKFYGANGRDLANLLKTCTTDYPAAQGELKAVLVSPVTELSKCVAVGFTHLTVPDPGEEFAEKGLSLLLPIKIK